MTSIDELFKNSGVPSKRRLEAVRDPNEVYKSARLAPNGSSSRHARVDNEADTAAGPSLPPDGSGDSGDDGDYGPAAPPDDEDGDEAGDDDEGRFFGGGITKVERSILDYVEGQDGADGAVPGAGKRGGGGRAPAASARAGEEEGGAAVADEETLDAAWLRKTVLNFEKCINRNAEQRARYESEPTRFIASEADLDAEIKGLSILAEHPALYPEFVRLGTAHSLVSLLAHENTDIAIAAIEILDELTDQDVDATDAQWVALVDALLEADLVGLLVSNLGRLQEGGDAADGDDADRTGVYRAPAIVENLASLTATRAAAAVGGHTDLLAWLLQRVQRKEVAANGSGLPIVTQNKQYAAEVLAVLAQAAPISRVRLVDLDAIDRMLQLVAAYRRRDPAKGSDEEEYMQNLFEALTYLVDDAADLPADALSRGKAKFVEAEGVELCLLMLKEGHKSRAPALRLLDHAATGIGAGAVCRSIVNAGGLKTLFTLFMKGPDGGSKAKPHHHHHHGKKKDAAAAASGLHAGPTAEALLSIFLSMLRLLPADADERIRLLAKFVEKDYEKIRQLLALRQEYAARVAAVDAQMDAEGRGPRYLATLTDREARDAIETERLSRRLDVGLYALQTLDIILAWLVAEDGGSRRTIRSLLADRASSFAVLRQSLEERRDELDVGMADGRSLHEMLTALLECLPEDKDV